MKPTNKFASILAAACVLIGAEVSAQNGNGKLVKYINSLPKQTVSTAERAQLITMRQEEKLARDVYQVLYLVWKIPAFDNIAKSEQSHMDLVKMMLDRYSIKDPLTNNGWGIYQDPAFTTLFVNLVLFGLNSPQHAVVVGAFIEDLDISDLNQALKVTDNRDIDTVWQNLQRGSRNHMRAFYGILAKQNLIYPGFVLNSAQIQAIVKSPNETKPVDENGVPLP